MAIDSSINESKVRGYSNLANGISKTISHQKGQVTRIKNEIKVAKQATPINTTRISELESKLTDAREVLDSYRSSLQALQTNLIQQNPGLQIPYLYAKAQAASDMVTRDQTKWKDYEALNESIKKNADLNSAAQAYANAFANYKKLVERYDPSNPFTASGDLIRETLKDEKSEMEDKKNAFITAWENAHPSGIGATGDVSGFKKLTPRFMRRYKVHQRTSSERALKMLESLGYSVDQSGTASVNLEQAIEDKKAAIGARIAFKQNKLQSYIQEGENAGVVFKGLNTPDVNNGFKFRLRHLLIVPLLWDAAKASAETRRKEKLALLPSFGSEDMKEFKDSDKDGFLKSLWVDARQEVNHTSAEEWSVIRRGMDQDRSGR